MKTKHDFDMVHGAQEVFRILLEALANPGRVLSLCHLEDQFTGQGRFLAPALTLLDQETGFFWDGDSATGEEIRFLTGAPQVELEVADFVFLSAPLKSGMGAEVVSILSRIKQGTHLDPHNSALLFIQTPVEAEGKTVKQSLFLRGPGIPPEGRQVEVSPVEAMWCSARDKQNFEYPCGVELVFLRDDGSVMALTRKTEFSWGLAPRSFGPRGRVELRASWPM
jgi:alpha-D-ribose 1-methylphosphonate 5-triphosphate synthase subunit PhnH